MKPKGRSVSDQLVHVDVQATPVVSLAMTHNKVPVVNSVRVTNRVPELSQATVRVSVHDGEGRVSRPWQTLVDFRSVERHPG